MEKHVEEMAYPVAADHQSDHEVFGDEKHHQIQYRTLSWQFVAYIMTAEVVTIGALGFPQAFAVVGLVPGLLVTIFCGVFALYTALCLIDFKLNHPEVHSMGDAGFILLSPIKLGWLGREVLSTGTIIFAAFSVGALQLSGGLAIATLADEKLCAMVCMAIFAVPVLLAALPRTLDLGLNWLSAIAFVSILISCVIGMVAAGLEPVPDRQVEATISQSFSVAFLTITNPVIAYAGHFMFFPLMSEMKEPRDAKKSAWFLQIFATILYVVVGIVFYVYIGSDVTNPSFLNLTGKWGKAAWGLILPNLLVCGALYNHVAAKIIFVRIFRNSRHLHSHTPLAWAVWVGLLILTSGVGYVLATGIAVFFLLAGIAAAAFASWYTYGLAGVFWWHDTHVLGHAQAFRFPAGVTARGWTAVRRRPVMFAVAVVTIVLGAFICVAGLYAIIKSLADAYASGQVGKPFVC